MSFKSFLLDPSSVVANWKMCWTQSSWALCALIAISGACSAQPAATPYREDTGALPEVIVVPIKVEGEVAAAAGWILTFRNQQRGAEAPLKEIGGKTIPLLVGNQAQDQNQISWEIIRTPNVGCRASSTNGCHDTLRVLSVPFGFIAVPQGGSVDEGGVLWIYILPAGMV